MFPWRIEAAPISQSNPAITHKFVFDLGTNRENMAIVLECIELMFNKRRKQVGICMMDQKF